MIKLALEEKYKLVSIVNDLMSICNMNVDGIAEEVRRESGLVYDEITRIIWITYREITRTTPNGWLLDKMAASKEVIEEEKEKIYQEKIRNSLSTVRMANRRKSETARQEEFHEKDEDIKVYRISRST